MKDRKPIQIAAADGRILALCDDGTIWRIHISDDEWRRLPNIPNDNDDE